MSGRRAVTVCFFGDGGLTQGIFHEAANMASVWKLPIVFVCENNQYAMSLPWSKAAGQPSIQAYASSYAMHGVDVDGQDVLAVQRVAQEAIERARNGGGPSLIGAYTYRFLGHSRGDPSKYRDPEEEKRERERDPLLILRSKHANLLDDQAVAQAEAEVKAMLDEAVAFAEASPIAGANAVFSEIYA